MSISPLVINKFVVIIFFEIFPKIIELLLRHLVQSQRTGFRDIDVTSLANVYVTLSVIIQIIAHFVSHRSTKITKPIFLYLLLIIFMIEQTRHLGTRSPPAKRTKQHQLILRRTLRTYSSTDVDITAR